MQPRAIRNNNPLNIRRSGDRWEGQAVKQKDPSFVQFAEMKYGWRAAFLLLTRTYYHKYRCYTIRKIIERWAPPNENNTRTYVERVSNMMHYDADVPLGIPSEHPDRWMQLGCAMAIVEAGPHALDYMAMLEGWGLARRSAQLTILASLR
jgi:hypothetical protein